MSAKDFKKTACSNCARFEDVTVKCPLRRTIVRLDPRELPTECRWQIARKNIGRPPTRTKPYPKRKRRENAPMFHSDRKDDFEEVTQEEMIGPSSSGTMGSVFIPIVEIKKEKAAPPPQKNPHAVALGRLGGLKGGKSRAQSLTPARRKEIAQQAARSRWNKP